MAEIAVSREDATKSRLARFAKQAGAGLITAITIASGAGCSPSSTESSPSASPVAEAPGAPNACPAGMEQQEMNDLVTANIIMGGIDADTPRESLEKMLDAARQDADVLYAMAYAFGLENIPKTKEGLLTPNGECLSPDGQRLLYNLEGLVKNTSTGLNFAEVPSDWYNTGVDTEGNLVINAEPGIGGDLKSLEITLPDGRRIIILLRCANPAFPGNPGLPIGQTDHQMPQAPDAPWVWDYPVPEQPEAPKQVNEHPVYTGNAPAYPMPPAPEVAEPATPPGAGSPPEVYVPAPAPAPEPQAPAPEAVIPEQPRVTLPPEGGEAVNAGQPIAEA